MLIKTIQKISTYHLIDLNMQTYCSITCFFFFYSLGVKFAQDDSKLRNMCFFLCASQSDKAQRVEVDEMLRTILEFEQKDPARIAQVGHCLAMLWFLGGDFLKVSHLARY